MWRQNKVSEADDLNSLGLRYSNRVGLKMCERIQLNLQPNFSGQNQDEIFKNCASCQCELPRSTRQERVENMEAKNLPNGRALTNDHKLFIYKHQWSRKV